MITRDQFWLDVWILLSDWGDTYEVVTSQQSVIDTAVGLARAAP